jgi:TolA-binding protein
VFAPELNQRVRRSMNEAEPVRRVEDLPEVAPEPKELEQAEAPRREPPRAAMPVQKSSEPVEKDNPGLNEEIALLDAARAAVNAGRPTEALERLDDHSRRFPKGSLALEAEVVRVQALAAAGRSEEASRRAKRVLSRSPNSVVAARLRRYVLE